jgi:hypothetical protein
MVEYNATTPEVKLFETEVYVSVKLFPLDIIVLVTTLEPPPPEALPHVTTLPLDFSAANAVVVEYTATTSEVKL